jgi:hypothetical protein
MIPISPDVLMPHKDEEKNITYFFKPLIGETEFLRDKIIEKMQGDVNQYLEQARAELKDGNPEQVRDKAREMARSKKTLENLKEETDLISQLIDSLLVKWDGGGAQKDPGRNSSEYFKIADRYKLFRIILNLNDITEIEAKN